MTTEPLHAEQDYEPHRTTSEPRPGPNYFAAKIAQLVWLIITIIVGMLAIRIVLSLLGANPGNPFADFIYSTTAIFVEPFRGLLQVGEFQYGVVRFEFETLVAMFVYLMIGWAISAAISVLRSRP